VILDIAVWLDSWQSVHRSQSEYLFPFRSSEKATKDAVYIAMKEIWDDDSFVVDKPGRFGTHSCRKRLYTKMKGVALLKIMRI